MDKKDDFKQFVKSKPELVNYIKNKEYTWQDFYELYDLYGEDNNVWSKYSDIDDSNDNRNNSLNELTNLVKNINIDNVQKYINNAQKAINVISELTAKKPTNVVPNVVPKTPRVINKFFGD